MDVYKQIFITRGITYNIKDGIISNGLVKSTTTRFPIIIKVFYNQPVILYDFLTMTNICNRIMVIPIHYKNKNSSSTQF